MPLTPIATGFTASIAQLCDLIARFGLARRLAGPLIILIWQRVRTAGTQVETLLARLQAGTLRRHPRRRAMAPRGDANRRRNTRQNLPRKRAWLVVMIPETAGNACQLERLLEHPEIPALLEAAPQLRRSLRPLCHMLGVTLPRAPVRPAPLPPPPAPPPDDTPPTAAPSDDPPDRRPPERDPPLGRARPPPGRRRHTRSPDSCAKRGM